MLETSKHIIFPDKTLFRAMKQDYSDYGEGMMEKTPEHVKKAQFTGNSIPLRNDHHNVEPIGHVSNIRFQNSTKSRWLGDVVFEKKHLSSNQQHQLLTLQKKDLSIGFTFKKKGNLQTEILVDHVAWVHNGRCGAACSLHTGKDEFKDKSFIYDVFNLTECEEKDITIKKLQDELRSKQGMDAIYYETSEKQKTRIKELEDQLKAFDAQKDAFVKFQQVERDGLITEIQKVSKFTDEELKGFDAVQLKEKLEILQKSNNIPITDGYPPGDETKSGSDSNKKPFSAPLKGDYEMAKLLPKDYVDKLGSRYEAIKFEKGVG